MGVLQAWYLAYWCVSNCFFHELSYVRGLDLPFLSLFSLPFALPSTLCLVSWIPRIPVLWTPGGVVYQSNESIPSSTWLVLAYWNWAWQKRQQSSEDEMKRRKLIKGTKIHRWIDVCNNFYHQNMFILLLESLLVHIYFNANWYSYLMKQQAQICAHVAKLQGF